MRAAHTAKTAPSLTQLRAFAAVADAGTFSAAAVELGMAQSSVSRAVRSLEAALDAILLEREPTGVRLTVTGSAVLADARHALALIDGLPHAGAGARLTGVVRIGAFRSAAERLLPPVLGRFSDRHPELSVRVQTIPERNGAIALAVNAGSIDLGITSMPVSGDLVSASLFNDPYIRIDPTHRARRQLPFILWDEDCSHRATAWLGQQAIAERRTLQLDDDRAVLAHVAQGLGYTIMPALSAAGAQGVRRQQLPNGPTRTVGLCASPAAMRRREIGALYYEIKHALAHEPPVPADHRP
jgi:DNA-binding transcriptional LysR family regulator